MDEKKTIYDGSDSINPSAYGYIISVSLATLLMAVVIKFALYSYPENPEFVAMEKVASETFSQYSQRLDNIRNEYLEELEGQQKK